MSEKVKAQHIARKAMLYVRSRPPIRSPIIWRARKLQYAMQDRLRQLGWREIEVVDEDLGRSAAGMVTRTGFERMVSEVCLGRWAPSPPGRSPASRATVGSGSS